MAINFSVLFLVAILVCLAVGYLIYHLIQKIDDDELSFLLCTDDDEED